jgi:hypothetical protein
MLVFDSEDPRPSARGSLQTLNPSQQPLDWPGKRGVLCGREPLHHNNTRAGADFRLAITATDKNNQNSSSLPKESMQANLLFPNLLARPRGGELRSNSFGLSWLEATAPRIAFTKLAVSSLHLPTLVDVTDSIRKLLPKIQEKRHIE